MKRFIYRMKSHFFRPGAQKLYKDMCRESMLSEDERQALILSRIQETVKNAFENSRFYREKYSRVGFEPGDLKTLRDFEALPPLSKPEVRENCDAICCQNAGPEFRKLSTTGGSSGEPLAVYHDKRVQAEGIQQYILETLGCDISDNRGTLERYNPLKKHPFLNRLIWFPTRRCHLEANLIDDAKCTRFYEECLRVKPRTFYGYVGAIHQFAEFLARKNLTVSSLKEVISTAAPLTEPDRAFMESVFHCPVLSQYGCSEVFWLAMECNRKEGLHYFDTIRHIEIVDDEFRNLSHGEFGEVLLTDLLNRVFPLIRYRNGDRACKLDHKCSCGSQFPLLAPIKGRVTDMLYFPDGSSLAGDFLTTLFDDHTGVVKQFQIIQKADYSIILRYVPCENAVDLAGHVEQVRNNLKALFSEAMRKSIVINLESVSSLPHDKGKTRFILSEIKK